MKGSRVAWDVGEDKLIDDLAARIQAPYLYVSLTWKVYGRTEDGEWPVLEEVIHDLHVFIVRHSGEHIVIRGEDWDPKAAAEFLELAEHVPLEYSIHRAQLELVLDESHRVIFGTGGQRGGKTQAAALWTIRQWLIKGGRGILSYWIAPDRDLAYIAVQKLCVGEDDEAPLLPPELLASYPSSSTTQNPEIVLIDGFKILQKYASEKGKGRNIKGRGPRFITVDEACEIRPIEVWRVIRGRLNKRGGFLGQCFLSSTPMPGHWSHAEIILPVDAGRKPRFTYAHLSMVDNPWIPLSEVAEAIEDAGGEDDPICQREVFGKFVPDGQALWYAFRAEKHIRPFQDLEDLGLVDRTATMALRAFPGTQANPHWLGGQDYNLFPMSTLVAKVGIPKALLDACRTEDERRVVDVPENYVFVAVREIQTRNVGPEMHGHRILEVLHEEIPIACDPSGAQPGHRVDGKRGDKETRTDAEDLALSGHDVRPCNRTYAGEPYAPPQIESLKLVHKLQRTEVVPGIPRWIAHPRCRELFKSSTQQQATARGGIYKRPGTKSDQMSSITDAMRYLIWLCWRSEVQGPAPPLEEEGYAA